MSNESENSNQDDRPVDRCVCFDQTFESILSWCSAHDAANLNSIRDQFGCGRGCGMCVPYLKEMLRTGEVRFAVMPEQQSHPDENI